MADGDGGRTGRSGHSLLDFAVANTGSADANAFSGAFDDGVNGLQVQIPAALGDVVGVTDAMTILRSTTANFTNFRHLKITPASRMRAQLKSLAGLRAICKLRDRG